MKIFTWSSEKENKDFSCPTSNVNDMFKKLDHNADTEN